MTNRSSLRRGAAAGALLVVSALLVPTASPQGQASQDEAITGPIFSFTTEVSSILVPVTVRDRKGRPVATLERDKFQLYVDGMRFPIKNFWREGGLPLSLTFVVDTSGSMGGRRLRRAREVIGEFLRQRGPQDEFALITFGANQVKRRMRFGTDPDVMPRVLESLKGFGTTALYDMLGAVPNVMEGATNIRRAVVFFTDGVDTASQLTPSDAIRILEELSDPLYVFGIEPPPMDGEIGPSDSYEVLLKRFAEASGGRYVPVEDVASLPSFGRELRRELSMRYIINIEPSGVGSSKWRKLDVVVDGNFQVQTRQGYRGTLP